VASRGGENVAVFLQTHPGTFDPTPVLMRGDGALSARDVLAADLDGDGDIDLTATNNADLRILWGNH